MSRRRKVEVANLNDLFDFEKLSSNGMEEFFSILKNKVNQLKNIFSSGVWTDNIKGTCAESLIVSVLKDMGICDEQIIWHPGSRTPGRDLCVHSCKTIRITKEGWLSLSGSRTSSFSSLEEKIKFHDDFNYKTIIGLSYESDKDEIKFWIINPTIFKSNPEDWKKSNSVNVYENDDVKMTIGTEKNSGQYWYEIKSVEKLIQSNIIKQYSISLKD